MKAVILCGGLGSRLGSLCLDTPKSLMKINNKTVLEHQLDMLKKEGINEFIFVVGYLHEKIISYFSDGKNYDVQISYYIEEEPLGTGGALFKLNLTDDFLLCNGDLIFDFNLKAMKKFHEKNQAWATLLTHPNTHPYDSTLICADENGRIKSLVCDDREKNNSRNLCNSGIQIISPKLLRFFNIDGKVNFDRDIIEPAIKTSKIFSYKSTEYVCDMGTVERLKKVENDILTDLPRKKRLTEKQKAIFLDRDGTINVYKGFIKSEGEVELINGVTEAISVFNNLGYLVIVVTNQPVIARGDCTEDMLNKIHGRLECLLGKEGAFIDDIFYCPHHPNSGFEGEIRDLKIECYCRKPFPGMLVAAKEKYNIDMTKSYMVGDSVTDVQAGENAGCIPVLLDDNSECDCMKFRNLKRFSDFILGVEHS